jgi:regulator of chromosome condensation
MFSFYRLSAGEHHSMALDTEGTVWVWGRGDSGQLGLGSFDSVTETTALPMPFPCVRIAAGSSFSLALTKEKGDNAYGWGYGEMGQLANSGQDSKEPRKMNLKGRIAMEITAGGQHSVLVVKNKSDKTKRPHSSKRSC